MNKYKISVVTPSFNQGVFLEEAIKSVQVQNGFIVEHLIVDNCSTDQTSDVLAAYPHLIKIVEKDKGQSDALNKGFRLAKGDIIGWLNADDRYLPDCFIHVVEFFGKHPEIDVVYGDYRVIDAAGKILKIKKELPFNMFALKYHHVLCIPSTACFFKRRIFDEGNFLDTSYHYSMDYEFFLRLALKGYRFVHVSLLMADFRWHADAKSSQATALQVQERERALIAHDSFFQGIPVFFRRIFRFIFMILSRFKRMIQKLFL